LKPGADADVTVLDSGREWQFVREESASKSRNTPFHNWPLKGRAICTIVRGQVVWREENRNADV
jgi:dihydroorotase